MIIVLSLKVRVLITLLPHHFVCIIRLSADTQGGIRQLSFIADYLEDPEETEKRIYIADHILKCK